MSFKNIYKSFKIFQTSNKNCRSNQIFSSSEVPNFDETQVSPRVVYGVVFLELNSIYLLLSICKISTKFFYPFRTFRLKYCPIQCQTVSQSKMPYFDHLQVNLWEVFEIVFLKLNSIYPLLSICKISTKSIELFRSFRYICKNFAPYHTQHFFSQRCLTQTPIGQRQRRVWSFLSILKLNIFSAMDVQNFN